MTVTALPADRADACASTPPVRVALIIGSTREGRFGPTVAAWFAEQAAARAAIDLDVVDLADVEVPHVLAAHGSPPADAVAALGARLAAADAFAVVTPEYNHSFPASLKNAIDHFRDEWVAKPVALVSYGGMGGGIRAAEQLRLVFAELHAVTVRDNISFHGAHTRFDETGRPVDGAAADAAAAHLLDQLLWWARVLRRGRDDAPYPG